jgi:hypothetical protein
VVQVDSRHLTRSMYRQLDEAALRRFEPFGRVKDNKRELTHGVLLVDRDSKTGAARPLPCTTARLVAVGGARGVHTLDEPLAQGPRKDQLLPRISSREL